MSRSIGAIVPQGRTPPLALRNVLHGGPRSLAAIAGIVFVVVMVLLQLGFFGAVEGRQPTFTTSWSSTSP